jgi:16S rRNA (cytidine1402-2'-O)-methyltransferase
MLYIIGTPIGNLEDITLRALRILKSVDLVLAEDTRRTSVIFKTYDIKVRKLLSYNEHNKSSRENVILSYLEEGKDIALLTDAGMPLISDPGYDAVKLAYDNNYDVTTIPGPTAFISALILSGFKPVKFTFFGFLPRDKKRRRLLRSIKDQEGLFIFYDSPYRINKTLKDIFEIMGEVECAVVKEITKIHEQVLKGKVSELLEKTKDLKGELVLIINNVRISS